MTLVDTSVWIDHLRQGNRALAALLEAGEVLCHPFVIGEVACGHLRQRQRILTLLASLPSAPLAGHEEVMRLVDGHRLAGSGIGWLDAHLLASTRLAGVRLWTLDRRLRVVARRLGVLAGSV